jgi:hypothetical protein
MAMVQSQKGENLRRLFRAVRAAQNITGKKCIGKRLHALTRRSRATRLLSNMELFEFPDQIYIL